MTKDAQIKHCTELTQVYDMYSDMKANETEDIKEISASLASRLQRSLDSLHQTQNGAGLQPHTDACTHP